MNVVIYILIFASALFLPYICTLILKKADYYASNKNLQLKVVIIAGVIWFSPAILEYFISVGDAFAKAVNIFSIGIVLNIIIVHKRVHFYIKRIMRDKNKTEYKLK